MSMYSVEQRAIITKVRADPASSFTALFDITDAEILEFHVPGEAFRLRPWDKELLLARRKEAARAVLAGEPPDYEASDQRAREFTQKVFEIMRGSTQDE